MKPWAAAPWPYRFYFAVEGGANEPRLAEALEAIEALEESLAIYPGTILLVTHDRLFLERLELTASYLLENGALTPVADYATYEKEALSKVTRVLKRLEEKHGK